LDEGVIMATLEVRELVKRYGSITAVDGIDLHAVPGEVLAILGPNGAGKTSCLEILEGYRRRDGGTVRVLGTDPAAGGAAWRDRIGVLLQTTSVEPQLTVVEAMRLYASLYSRPRPVDELLVLADLEDVRHRRAGSLSGGQQRRLDLALAIAGHPELVFLDEPTTGFDPAARRRTWGLVQSLAAAGTTVVLTTHYLEEAAQLANRVVVIARGRVVAEGDPATLGGHFFATTATIRFRLPAEVSPLTVPWADRARDGVVEIQTGSPTALLASATAWAVETGLELPDLTVSRPTLEDVYLTLTEATHA
jgi:ABC-2 type transport system ATP-binding protein